MLFRFGDSENLTVYDLTIVVYKKHKKTFEKAEVDFCELQFFALVHPDSVETYFLK